MNYLTENHVIKAVIVFSLLIGPLVGQFAMAHVCCYTARPTTVKVWYNASCTVKYTRIRIDWKEYRPYPSPPGTTAHTHYGETGAYTYTKSESVPSTCAIRASEGE